MWAATSCLGAWRPLYKGAAARFAPFHLQKLGLERETRERKCRFEAKIAYLEETQKGSRCKIRGFVLSKWFMV
uniref:Uncharacterized protein n=1 Tax=Vitis vinifera TaxID=29760 RepID=F6H879_VITVI